MGSGPSNAEPRVLQAMAAAPLPGRRSSVRASCSTTWPSACGRSFRRRGRRARWRCRAPRARASRRCWPARSSQATRVLVGVYGHFGELLCTLATRHGAVVERVRRRVGQRRSMPRRSSARCGSSRRKLVAIVHADTSTGILQPLEAIGAACREAGALLRGRRRAEPGRLRGRRRRLAHRRGRRRACRSAWAGRRGWRCWLTRSAPRRRSASVRVGRDSAYLDLARLVHDWRHAACAHGRCRRRCSWPRARRLRMVLDEGLAARWARHAQASRALRRGPGRDGARAASATPRTRCR